jgi:virulence factor
MLKIGVIGLGDIADKAYLPVISKKKVEVHLCSRHEARLHQVGEQYRFKNLHTTIDSLISSGITGAFVHTATASHFEIVEQLLKHNIHVYVDKPVTHDYTSTEKLASLASSKGLLLMAGFNRRYVPAYQELKSLEHPNMIIMQKNRKALPGEVRHFVFDDFIHVVDTLLYFFPHPVNKMTVQGRKKNGVLHHLVIHLISNQGVDAIGIMNRDCGTVEERLEVFSEKEKRVAYNLSEVTIYKDKHENKLSVNDWQTLTHRRGFDQIVDDFLRKIESGSLKIHKPDFLLTHKICESIVQELIA